MNIKSGQAAGEIQMNKAENSEWRGVDPKVKTDRRAYERYPSQLKARLFFGNLIYSGMVTDLSMNGMFVSTKVGFPVNSEFMMVVLLNDRSLKIPVKVRRRVKGENSYSSKTSGIGVELLVAPQNYMDYVNGSASA